jgi:cytochrome P450
MLPSMFKSPFLGILAHHPGPDISSDHGETFHAATICQGVDSSTYFKQSGIADLAEKNEGICTFLLNGEIAIYQNTNRPLANDEDLAPSISSNAELFGSFMGSLHVSDSSRHAKRSIVERLLGNAKLVASLDEYVITHTQEYLTKVESKTLPLDEFVILMIAQIDSALPGVLDFYDKPLTNYLSSDVYGEIARNFFEIASEVISKFNTSSIRNTDLVVDMIRDMLEANFVSLSSAPPTNIVRAQFALWGYSFSLASIYSLTSSELKELGTIIIAIYDTTSISLLWTIAYLEAHTDERQIFLDAIDADEDPLLAASLIVLEALRLAGSNPTALWRRTIRPIEIEYGGRSLTIPKDTMLWLDRRLANRDETVFPHAGQFDTNNIKHIMKTETEQAISMLARNRYEINSFNMINTMRSPRKCPGRLFSVREQSLVLVELYRLYDVNVSGIDLNLACFSSMPRPKSVGTIFIKSKC